jgi:hypothetical protein
MIWHKHQLAAMLAAGGGSLSVVFLHLSMTELIVHTRTLALHTNIRLGWTWLTVKNNLDYFDTEYTTSVNSLEHRPQNKKILIAIKIYCDTLRHN